MLMMSRNLFFNGNRLQRMGEMFNEGQFLTAREMFKRLNQAIEILLSHRFFTHSKKGSHGSSP